jgi:REP element-mobilizing transposase RayT
MLLLSRMECRTCAVLLMRDDDSTRRVYRLHERKRNLVGQHFWARGFFVSTVGWAEAVIRSYIQKQEQEDQRLDQMKLRD